MDTGPRSGGEIAGHNVICHPREVADRGLCRRCRGSGI